MIVDCKGLHDATGRRVDDSGTRPARLRCGDHTAAFDVDAEASAGHVADQYIAGGVGHGQSRAGASGQIKARVVIVLARQRSKGNGLRYAAHGKRPHHGWCRCVRQSPAYSTCLCGSNRTRPRCEHADHTTRHRADTRGRCGVADGQCGRCTRGKGKITAVIDFACQRRKRHRLRRFDHKAAGDFGRCIADPTDGAGGDIDVDLTGAWTDDGDGRTRDGTHRWRGTADGDRQPTGADATQIDVRGTRSDVRQRWDDDGRHCRGHRERRRKGARRRVGRGMRRRIGRSQRRSIGVGWGIRRSGNGGHRCGRCEVGDGMHDAIVFERPVTGWVCQVPVCRSAIVAGGTELEHGVLTGVVGDVI